MEPTNAREKEFMGGVSLEHIIQFGVTIDDDKIEKHAVEMAANALTQEFKQKLWTGGYCYTFTPQAASLIEGVIEKYKDQIIDKASEMLYESMKRSKKVKEAVGKVVEEI